MTHLSAILAGCLVASSSSVAYGQARSEERTPEATRLESWTKFLEHIVKTEDVQLVAPITLEVWSPMLLKRRYGAMVLPILAHMMHARYQIIEGAVVLQKIPQLERTAKRSGSSTVTQWLKFASDSDMQSALSEEGMPLRSMPLDRRTAFITKLGMPTQMAEGFFANGDDAHLSVRYVIDVSGTTSTGRPLRYRFAAHQRKSYADKDERNYSFSEIPANKLSESEGEFDFGAGQVFKVQDLKAHLRAEFGKAFISDWRLDKSYVFLSGKFTWDKLLLVLRKALDVHKVEDRLVLPEVPAEETIEIIKNRLEGVLYDFTGATGIDARWGLEKRKLDAGFLASLSPAFAQYLARRKISGEGILMTLSPGILFNISAPGETRTVSPTDGRLAGIFKHSFTFVYRP